MGLPVFGISNYSNPQWIPEPNNRGTWGLVQSCLLTLGLCVYSAIHLNVFHRECSWWTRYLIRCKWLVVALLAPEAIVFNAWSQRRQAVRLARVLRRRSGQEEPVSCFLSIWNKIWSRTRIVDQENGSCKRHDGHVSKQRVQYLGQEKRHSQHTPQEQDETQEQDGAKSLEGSIKVRLREPFLQV